MCFLQALRVPTIVFLSLAVLVIVISILLVWRHLYRTWRNVIPEEADAADNLAAQQDKELSLIESQLNRTTPIVVLQPDSKVRPGCCCYRKPLHVPFANGCTMFVIEYRGAQSR